MDEYVDVDVLVDRCSGFLVGQSEFRVNQINSIFWLDFWCFWYFEHQNEHNWFNCTYNNGQGKREIVQNKA